MNSVILATLLLGMGDWDFSLPCINRIDNYRKYYKYEIYGVDE